MFQNYATLLLLALINVSVAATGPLQRQCVEGDGESGVVACAKFARKLSADLSRLKRLAAELESRRRFVAAMAVYKTAAEHYPGDRTVLQGLIRTRSAGRQLRSSRESTAGAADATAAVGRDSRCWSDRPDVALPACREELARSADKAVLHERIGDILRAGGRGDEAIHAYERGLAHAPGDSALVTKHSALRALLKDNADPAEEIADTAPGPASPRDVVAQLELLEKLFRKDLIAKPEYDARRGAVLNHALVSTEPAEIEPVTKPAERIDRSEYGRYVALVIGNEQYENRQRLRTPVNDVVAISSLLRDDYGFDVTTLRNADRYTMAKALSDLRRNTAETDNVLVYFAGHGHLDEVTRRGYWLPVDAEADSQANWISTSDVTDTLAAIPAAHAMVIADSCFSGSLLRGSADTIGKLRSKRSRTVITSGGLEPVLDGGRSFGRNRHSVFANALLNELRSNNSPLEAGRLFLAIRDIVSNNAEQTPQYAPIRNAGHDGGDFIFVPAGREQK